MVVTGAKSEDDSRLASRKYARIIQKLGFDAKFAEFKIQNIVGSCDVKFPIRLEGLAFSHGAFSSYEPEVSFSSFCFVFFHSSRFVLSDLLPIERLCQWWNMEWWNSVIEWGSFRAIAGLVTRKDGMEVLLDLTISGERYRIIPLLVVSQSTLPRFNTIHSPLFDRTLHPKAIPPIPIILSLNRLPSSPLCSSVTLPHSPALSAQIHPPSWFVALHLPLTTRSACSTLIKQLFPGLIYRMMKPKVVLLIFVSGKIVLTGAKVREEIYMAFNQIYSVLVGTSSSFSFVFSFHTPVPVTYHIQLRTRFRLSISSSRLDQVLIFQNSRKNYNTPLFILTLD